MSFPTLYTGVDQRLELTLRRKSDGSPIVADAVYFHIADTSDAAPMVALSSEDEDEVVEVDAEAGRWDVLLPRGLPLVPGRHAAKVFAVLEDGTLEQVGPAQTVVVESGWVSPPEPPAP